MENLTPHEKDDEVLTLTRRDLRIIVNAVLSLDLDQRIDERIAAKLNDHVLLETVQ